MLVTTMLVSTAAAMRPRLSALRWVGSRSRHVRSSPAPIAAAGGSKSTTDLPLAVLQALESHIDLPMGSPVLVSLSGGSDSVALLRVMVELNANHSRWCLSAVHFNHGLRTESKAEETFVRALCAEHAVPLHVRHLGHDRQQAVGMQERTRTWRREESLSILRTIGRADDDVCLPALCSLPLDLLVSLHRLSPACLALLTQRGLDREPPPQRGEPRRGQSWRGAVMLAHHADDQLETLLLKCLRGCHLSNLHGMRWQDGPFVRPLLGQHKVDLLAYLEGIGQVRCPLSIPNTSGVIAVDSWLQPVPCTLFAPLTQRAGDRHGTMCPIPGTLYPAAHPEGRGSRAAAAGMDGGPCTLYPVPCRGGWRTRPTLSPSTSVTASASSSSPCWTSWRPVRSRRGSVLWRSRAASYGTLRACRSTWHTYIHTHAHTHAHTHTHTPTHTHTRLHTRLHTRTRMHMHVHLPARRSCGTCACMHTLKRFEYACIGAS